MKRIIVKNCPAFIGNETCQKTNKRCIDCRHCVIKDNVDILNNMEVEEVDNGIYIEDMLEVDVIEEEGETLFRICVDDTSMLVLNTYEMVNLETIISSLREDGHFETEKTYNVNNLVYSEDEILELAKNICSHLSKRLHMDKRALLQDTTDIDCCIRFLEGQDYKIKRVK